MLYIGNTRYRVYSGRDRVSIECPEKQDSVIKNTLLPSGLELYDYIESSGTQYIDTEYIPTNFTKVILDFKNNVTNDGFFFGGRDEYNGTSCFCLHKDYAQFGNDMGSGCSITTSTSRNLIALSQEGIYINNILKHTYANKTFTSPKTLKLFAMEQSAGMYSTKSSISVYMFKVYDNNILIRDFVPAKYNGEPGMWDTVESKFYGNEGSGEFTLGNKIVLREYEYLENVSNSYINLDYIPTNTTGVKIEASPNRVQSSQILLGRGSSSNNTRWWLNFTSGGSLSLGWNTAYSVSNSYQANTWYVIKHNYLNSRTNSVNNIVADSQYPNLTLTSDPISLFTNKTDPSNYVFTGKVKYLYITEGDQIVRNFVPCTYNGIPGMWDKVELKFYGSSNNGTFIVSNEIKCYDYLQNDGVAYIDTEIKNIVNTEIELVAQQTKLNSGGYYTLLGANETADTFKVIFVYGSAVFYSQPTARGNSTIIGDIDTDKHTFKANLKTNDVTFGFDNTTITDSYAITNTTTYSLYLFARNNRGRGANGNSKMKVYSLKVKDNGKLIKDFRPCIYNDEVGLWDSVERKFYGNANNTGTLTVGNNS